MQYCQAEHLLNYHFNVIQCVSNKTGPLQLISHNFINSQRSLIIFGISGPTSKNVSLTGQKNKWQNDCGAVSMPKDSIRTRVVTFETANILISIETCLFKYLPFLFIRQHKLWNDMQLRIATVTHFSWYFAASANTTVFFNFVT